MQNTIIIHRNLIKMSIKEENNPNRGLITYVLFAWMVFCKTYARVNHKFAASD